MDERTIVDLFWQRSEDALTQCARRYGAYCLTVTYNILRSRPDAEECVNETWLRAWQSIPPARPRSLKTYLGRISRNLALDRYEKSRAQKRGGGEIDVALEELTLVAAPESASDEEIAHIISSFLCRESTEHADIFVKRYWYLMTVKEISRQYGYSVSKTASILFRMRRRLKSNLESEGLI